MKQFNRTTYKDVKDTGVSSFQSLVWFRVGITVLLLSWWFLDHPMDPFFYFLFPLKKQRHLPGPLVTSLDCQCNAILVLRFISVQTGHVFQNVLLPL